VLLQLLDVPNAPSSPGQLSPSDFKAQAFALLRQLSLHGGSQPLRILAVEDLHWIDPTSEEWLASLVEQMAGTALLLVVTYRPGYRPPWLVHSAATQLALTPLTPRESLAVVQAVPQAGQLSAYVQQAIVTTAAGNPFFLEELTWAAVDAGTPVTGLLVPETIQAVLAMRIDRLLPVDKYVLQTAAVIGKEVPVPLLQAVMALQETALHTSLGRLQASECLYETRLVPMRAYTFKHALLQEVAYGSLLQDQRRTLHSYIVEALEQLAPDQVAEQVERLAHHALRGEVWAKAVTYGQQAGARAHDRAAFREAVTSFEQALQALAHLPEDGDTRMLALELRLALAWTLNALGELGRRLALLGEAESLARALDDRASLAQVLASMGHVRRLTGDFEGAIVASQQALDLAVALGDSALQMLASHTLGQACYAIGDFSRAAELLGQNVEAADRESGTPSTGVRIASQAWLARTLSMLGAFAEGRRHGEEALRLATLEGRGDTPIMAHACCGLLYLAQGDLEHAIRVLEQGLALCRACGGQNDVRPIAAGLGYAYVLQGRLAEGCMLLEEGISESIRMGALFGHALWVAWLSEVCRLAGRGEEAWQHARQALDLARQCKERGNEALALFQLGAVHAHNDPSDAEQAEAYYQQALALAEALGMRPLQAHCHLGLGTLYAKAGQPEQARTTLSTAVALYCTMDMAFWLPRAEAALAQVEGQ
jgi:tetratricopeptide (TPR) repeat protein